MPRPSPAPAAIRRSIRWALVALAAAWAAWNLGVALAQVAREVRRPPNPGAVAEWRLTTPREEGLEFFLGTVDSWLPADSRVAFTAESGNPDQEFFLSLWAAYHLPRHRVVRLLPDLDLDRVDHVVAYNAELDHPRLREVGRDFSGVLYRVAPEATREPGRAAGQEPVAPGERPAAPARPSLGAGAGAPP